MANFLVTGGAGFIGSNLVEAILARGDSARVLDDFSTGRRCNLEAASSWASRGGGSFEVLEGDIRDPADCRAAMQDVDFVLHMAAIPSVQRSVENPLETNEVNVGGTMQLLAAALEARVRRFVFASSSSIYGESETLPKHEEMPPDPISPYGLQKLTGESYCRLFHRLYGVPTVALRYFNVFGPRQDPASEYAAVIPRFIQCLSADRPPTIFGDGEQTRDFTFVANVVQANMRACEASEEALGKAYNVGCGSQISLNRLVSHIQELTGSSVAPKHDAPRSGDIRHSLASIDRAAKLLSYRPEVDLVDGLRETLSAFAAQT